MNMKYTNSEIQAFISGMNHAKKMAENTKRGHIAADAIQGEITKLKLMWEKIRGNDN